MFFAATRSLKPVALLAALLLTTAVAPANATGIDYEAGFVEKMAGPSTKPFSERLIRDPSGNDSFYQDCVFRIAGVEVGRATSARTDADGKHNPTGLFRTFVHDAGRLGKFTLTLKVQPDIGEVGFLPPVRVRMEPVNEATLAVHPQIAEIVLDGSGSVIPGYSIQSVSTDLDTSLTDPDLISQWKGKGIYNRVDRLVVRCTFLIAPNGDVVSCVECFFFFGK